LTACTYLIFNRLRNKPYTIFIYITLTKTCKMHCWYHKICMLVVTYSIAVCCKNILMSASWRWRDYKVETCRRYVIGSMYKL
jgi:hypothetical protein